MELHCGIKTFYAKTRKGWRNWLVKNHFRAKNVWLIIYHKNSNVASIYYPEAVEEALCFGWIDSKPNKRDEESFYLFFSKRKVTSHWSKVNKERVSQLVKQGLMTPAGQRMIDLAKKTGTWEALEIVDNIVIPNDLKNRFNKTKKALKNFEAFPPSSKKIILSWILNAKQDETRKKRIEETVRLAAQNIRANHYTK